MQNTHELIEKQMAVQFIAFLPQVLVAAGIACDVYKATETETVQDDVYGQYSGQKLYNDTPDFQIAAAGLPIEGFRYAPFDSYLRAGHFQGSESVFTVCRDISEGDVIQVCGSTERLIVTDTKTLGRQGQIFQLTVANIMSGEQTQEQTSSFLTID